MIQIDMEMPKFCWWKDGNDYRKCPMVDGKNNGCCLHGNVSYATWEEQHKHCPLHEVVTDEDTVSRQAAINAVEFGITYAKAIDVNTGESKELFKEGNDALKKAIERIKDLPFAQPNVPDTNVLDTISRQAAIEINRSYHGQMPNEVNHRIWKEINELPSAQSEHQKGEWIDYTEDGYVECPFCHSATNCDGNKDELHFCFSCGADMREPEDIPMEYFESGGR